MIGIVDYGAGNLFSVRKALDRLGLPSRPVESPAAFSGLSGLILPGVGHFESAAAVLAESGLLEDIRKWAAGGRPLLGICLGLQLFFERSEEGEGNRPGLGLFAGSVIKLEGPRAIHIGWNRVRIVRPGLTSLPAAGSELFYFVHGYVVHPADETLVAGLTEYGRDFPAVVGRGNILGVQFHPEKSGRAGLALLRDWGATCSR